MGRGTTLVEAGLMGRKVIGCDVNPVSAVYVVPRFHLPDRDKFSTFLSLHEGCFREEEAPQTDSRRMRTIFFRSTIGTL